MYRKEYILTRKAAGDARTVDAIGVEYDGFAALIDVVIADTPAQATAKTKAISDSAAVNTWLANRKTANPLAFETERKLPFAQQKTLAGVA